MKLKAILTAALLLVPTAALAAPGIVTVSTGLRAGPGPGFPLVDRIPGGSRVNVHGCLRGKAWCDVSWSDDRGWVSSQYLEYLYRNKYVYLPDYVDVIDVPVVPFVLSSYWSSYYSGRPWYQRRAYWSNYWTSHERFATQVTIDRSAARIGRAATRDAAIAEGRTPRAGVTERVTREQGAARIRGAREAQTREAQGRAAAAQARMTHEQARVVHEKGAARANARVQPMAHARMQPPTARAHEPTTARAHEAPRISAAPAARPAMPHAAQPKAQVAQPKVSHGPPANAHAQMPAPRAAPATPQAGGGAPAGGKGHERH
jgi:uncharacterized protein YraI